MATFAILRHPVTILVTDFTNLDNLTNGLLIFNSLIIFDPIIHVITKSTMFFIFNTQEVFSEQKRLTSLNLSGTDQGEPSTRPPSCTTPRQPKINGP